MPLHASGAALLRSILRLHTALPPTQRLLGDRMVLAEFRAAADALRAGKLKPELQKEFVEAWQGYSAVLRGQRQPQHDEHSLERSLSPEQREQLSRLRAEAEKLA